MKGTSPSRGAHAKAEYGIEVPRWEVRTPINSPMEGESMSIVCVGIDLAKNVFAVHGINESGKAELVRPSVARGKLLELIAGLPPTTIARFNEHRRLICDIRGPKFIALERPPESAYRVPDDSRRVQR